LCYPEGQPRPLLKKKERKGSRGGGGVACGDWE